MPELPEVETIKNTLKQFVIGKTIKKVTVYWPKIIKDPDREQFKNLLMKQKIKNNQRRKKYLLFKLEDYMINYQIRMEGKYSVHSKDEPIKKHTHVIFSFTEQKELRYNDVRKFGTMHLVTKGEE